MRKEDKRDFEERYTACFVDFGLKISKLSKVKCLFTL